MSHKVEQLNQHMLTAEIVGPAGAGKTTLLSALTQRTDRVRAIHNYTHWRYLPILARSAISLAPVLWDQWFLGGGFSWSRARRMTRLQASSRILRRHVASGRRLLVVDQGPVYTLAKLRMSQDHRCISNRQERWRSGVLDAASESLDFLIYIDADDDVLLERIMLRSKSHAIKHVATDEAKHYLDCYRGHFADLLRAFRHAGRTKIIRVQTDGSLPRESAEKILKACGICRGEHLLN